MQVDSGLIDRYVGVWNEPDPDMRRRRIESVWAPGGTTCYRLLDARGYEAIEARVTKSWERWLREGKYVFRPVKAISEDTAVKFEFAMVATADGKVEAQGLCYLLLDDDRRIAQDYQFNPTVDDAIDLAQKYLAPWNEPDEGVCRSLLAALWAANCEYRDGHRKMRGLEQLIAGAAQTRRNLAADGRIMAPMGRSQRHHNVAHIAWQIVDSEGNAAAPTGSTLLVMDESQKITAGYRFAERIAS
jgi:hypothetical protein